MELKKVLIFGLLGLWVIGLFGFRIYALNYYFWGYLISGLIMVMIIKILENIWEKKAKIEE
jgi:hypothetical protein